MTNSLPRARAGTRAGAATVAALLILVGLGAPAGADPGDEAPSPSESASAPADGETPQPVPTAPVEGDPTPTPEPTPEPGGTDAPSDGVTDAPGDQEGSPAPDESPAAAVAPQSVTAAAVPVLVAPLRAGVYRMTSPQGPRCAPTINASLAHMGQDLAAPLGTPIYAIAAGVVRYARPEAAAGQWIVIEHVIDGRVVSSSYSHSRNATEFVRAGDRVTAGQRIATVASTGVSTGPHLHLEIWAGRYGAAAGGTVVNPDTWLAARGVSLRAGATSVSDVKPPTSCTYWALGATTLYASPASSAAVIAAVRSGTVLTTPGAGVKTNGFIQVTTPTGVTAWAPAGQVSPKRTTVTPVPRHVLARDYTGDGVSDVLAVDSAGRLRLYAGNGAGGWASSRQVGAGWSGFQLIAANDFNRDGRADIFGVDATGRLYFYAGNGSGGFASRVAFGRGWSAMTNILSPGDFDGDGRADLVATDAAGRLWLYRGNGAGGFLAGRTQIGHGWQMFTQVIAGGDANRDGRPDIVAVDRSGRLFGYFGNGTGRFTGSRQLGHGWSRLQVHSVGGFDLDALDDYLAIAADGTMYLYRGSASGWVSAGKQVGRGWSTMRLA
ncbi:VCBS repeat domain-containing M23 family metallopeptidase [Occultella gossypii]|uniref:VCBS repeat-containing protein n=1 Tax=Occultella gossypii TaxID=2800820 RepID=A0ABS7SFZ4_9MICO|nr:VCBS repeat domain-containing M23 family metallopeptidase [Occultella gossypii]MBZ2199279.1 VCBS repeat-containing protein [Occultella gossypii]